MSKVVMATLLSRDWLSVVIILHLSCTESSNNTTVHHHENKTAPLGETVTLQCNDSAKEVTWIMETLSLTTFSYRFWKNKTIFNNLTSERMTIDPVNPFVLKIHNVQLNDTGNYSCIKAGNRGYQETMWSLTITDPNDKHKGPAVVHYIIPAAITGSALCIIVCCIVWWYSRKRRLAQSVGLQDTEVEDQNAQSNNPSGQRAQQYFERLNSIYWDK